MIFAGTILHDYMIRMIRISVAVPASQLVMTNQITHR